MYLAYVAYRLLKKNQNVVIVFQDRTAMYRLDSSGCTSIGRQILFCGILRHGMVDGSEPERYMSME